MKGKLFGGARITHSINKYGGFKGMEAGLRKFAQDNWARGYEEGKKNATLIGIFKNFFK